jgi:hypothetical protein
VSDLSGSLKVDEGTELVGERYPRVDAVQVVQVECFDAEAPQAQFGALGEVFGESAGPSDVRSGAGQAAFGGDQQVVGVGVQCFADQRFDGLRAVGVGGVEVVDAVVVDGGAQEAACRVGVGGQVPVAGPVSCIVP